MNKKIAEVMFFMLLFAKAGTLKYVGVTDIVANKFLDIAGVSIPILNWFNSLD
ncbi:MAG: hypothetical protein Q8R31_06720 [Candidatus Omnitrophota bacterium]|nr:hypothetical protein [Candidatus Omnitrophota bacterium]